MADIQITYRKLKTLTVNPCNARTHERKQIRQIKKSITTFGFTNPLIVDQGGILIAGHGRLAAALELGFEDIPVIILAHLSEMQKRGLMLADNKIAANAGWDMELLASELTDLSSMELDFDLDVTGFEVGEIDLLIESADGSPDQDDQAETAPEPNPADEIICQPGDLWLLGPHRVFCGDARNQKHMALLTGEEEADAGFTDPPYNVPINGHVSGKGQIKHREFSQASGEMSEAEFTAFLTSTLGLAARFSRDGAIWFACMDWRHMSEMLSAGQGTFESLINLCIWRKTNGGMGSLYRSQHELVFVWKKGRGSHRNNVQLGRFGRNRTNVWTYPGVNTFRRGRMDELHAHPTAKPVAMIKDALLDVTRRGDRVLDPFLGAGATLMAAERSGRVLRGMEIDPAYVDVTLRRWREETGEEPVRSGDGLAFSAIETEYSRGVEQ